MDTQELSRLAAIDFGPDIERLTEGFVGREWLFDEIDAWLGRLDERFFILTGEPGVGKSAIAARLTQVREDIAAHHFCIAGRNSTVVPSTALRSLAAQLGDHLPGYGQALATTIKPIHLSVQVDIDVETMTGGQITGVVINHLHASDPEEELDILVRAPLAELSAPEAPVLILVDSLDEAVTHRGQVNLVTLLAEVNDLPPWVRFLCTSRPEQRVLRYFDSLTPHILEAESHLNLEDVGRYIGYRVAKDGMPTRLQEADVEPKHLAGKVAKLADGSFLYAKVLLNDVESGRQALDDLEALPQSLDEIYHGFLTRFTVREWEDQYQPLFGVLAVAQEPLVEAQLAGFSGLQRTKVRQYLGVVQQFLEERQDGEGRKTFALFHQSLRDYLLDEGRNQDFWCAPKDGHRSIASHYMMDYDRRWSEIDLYGLRHLPTHLIDGDQWAELTGLLCDLGFVETKCAAGMTYDLVADYDRALARWLRPGPPIRTVRRDRGAAGIHCPFCGNWYGIGENQLGQMVICPACEQESKASPFVLTAKWPHSSAPTARTLVRDSTESPLSEAVSEFARFVQSQAHILSELPVLTLQQAANQPDSGAPARAARVSWESRAEKRPWLLWVNKPQEPETRLMTLPGSPIASCAYSPDGRRIVANSDFSTFVVWDAETGQEVATLEGIPGMVWDEAFLMSTDMPIDKLMAMYFYGCAFSPDGRHIVTGGKDYATTVWDAETGHVAARMEGHTDRIRACSYSPDGQRIVSASEDGTLIVWEVATGQAVGTLRGHQGRVTSCAYSPDGRRIVSGSWDNTLKVWKSRGGQEVATLAGHTDHVMACAYSPDGRFVLSASKDHTLKLWDTETGGEVTSLKGHSDEVMACAFSPDGQRIVSVSEDHTLRLWDGETGQELVSLEAYSHELMSCAYSPDGRRIATGSLHGPLKVWDVGRIEAMAETGGRPASQLSFGETEVPTRFDSVFTSAQAVAPDRRRMAVGSEDGILTLADATTGQVIDAQQGHQAGVLACTYSPDGRRIASASGDGTCKLWNARSLRELATFAGHSESVRTCAFSPDGRRLLSGSSDHTLKIWDAESGEELGTLAGHSDAVMEGRYSPDGHRIVSASRDHTVRIWDANAFSELAILEGHTDTVHALAYAPNSRQILSASWDGVLRLWDARTGRETATLQGHRGSIDVAAYSPDGLRVLSAAEDGTLRVWDSKTGEQMAIFFADEGVGVVGQNIDGSVVTAIDAKGGTYVLSLDGFDMGEPVIQAAYLYHFDRHRWAAEASTRCAWCARQLPVPDPVLSAIQGFAESAGLQPGQCPTEVLPDDAYDDPSLAVGCLHCLRPLRFNPFIVDNPERLKQKKPWWRIR